MTLAIDRRAALWGERVAVADYADGVDVTYAELAELAAAAAARLTELGIGSGDVVGLVSRNKVEVLALFFAAEELGAVFAPISHRLTPATVEGPYERIDPDVVVHESAQRDLVRGMHTDEIYSFDDLEQVERAAYDPVRRDPAEPLLSLQTEPGSDDAAVVEVSARQTEWNCITAAAAWGLGRNDCAPAFLPLSHTDGLHRLTLPLLYVGGLVVLQRAFDPSDTLGILEEYAATCVYGHAKELRELSERATFPETDLSSVEWFASGTRTSEAVREAYRDCGARLVHSYGDAESGPNALYFPPGRDVDAKPESVGRPFPDCDVRLVDEAGDPVETGAVGELEVAGPVTAAAPGEWLSTGDRARRDEDGDYSLVEDEDG